jgi:hypothetical protein
MTALIAAVVFLVAVAGCAGAYGLALLFDKDATYPPEAAEVPKSGPEEESVEPDVAFERARPLTEVGPLVVAGSDLDLSEARVNLLFATLTLPYAGDATEYAKGVVGLYVAPEVER